MLDHPEAIVKREGNGQGKRDAEVYGVLRTFRNRELGRLEDFINSPYCNKDETLRVYFNALVLFAPRFNLNEKQESELLPDQILDRRGVYLLNNQLLQKIEDFLLAESSDELLLNRELTLAREYRERNLRVRYNRSIRKAQRKLDEQPFLSVDSDLARYRLNRFLIEDHRGFAGNHKMMLLYGDFLQKAMNSLDELFMRDKMRLGVTMLGRQRVLRQNFDLRLLKQVVDDIESRDESLPNRLLAACAQLVLDPDQVAHFHHYKELLFQCMGFFEPTYYRSLFDNALNAATYHGNRKRKGFMQEYLGLVEKMIDLGIFTLQPLRARQYKNIVQLYILTGHNEDARTFLEHYHEFLVPDKSNQDVVDHCLALIAFAGGDYDEVLRIVQQISWDDPGHVVGLRLLKLQCLFEQDEHDLLSSELDALKTYLGYHNEIPQNAQQRTRKSLSYSRQLLKLRKNDKAGHETLLEQISQDSKMRGSAWFVDFLTRRIEGRQR